MTFVPPLQEMDKRRLDARLFRRVLRYLGPYRGPLILAVLLLLAAAGLQILKPLFIKWAIDRHITPGVLEGLWGLAALYLIVLALEGTVRYWQVTLTQF
ncbi:MAG: ABC transporter ATP-binding protein, partial [Candidatus Methylomirabilales bacterium]